MTDNNDWDNYFKNQYKSNFNREDINRAINFIYGQHKLISNHVTLSVDDAVLEIGCALGSFIELLKESGVKNISGIEIDSKAADFTQNTQQVPVSTSTIFDYTSEKMFDKIYAFEVLEHLSNPIQDIQKIYEILKPGGYFIASSPYPFLRSITSDKTHLFVLHPENWKRLFENAGFEVSKIIPATGIPYLYRYSRVLSLYLPFYVPLFPLVSTSLFICKKKTIL